MNLKQIEKTEIFRTAGAVLQGIILGILVSYSILLIMGLKEGERIFRYQGY